MKLASIRALVVSLTAVLVTLAGAAADSHTSPSSPEHAVVAVRALGEESSGIAGRVRVEARFRSPTRGTFDFGGAISDTGSLKAVRRVVGGRPQLTEVLAGKLGTIRIRAVSPCAGRSGTWQVLSGSGAYRGLIGGGPASGGLRCAATTYPARAIYTGTVRTPTPAPMPPLAQAGRFGGGTSQREEVVLDVEQGGRTFAGLRLAVMAPCAGPVGPARVMMSLPGPYEIGQDKSFAILGPESWWTGDIAGRFTSPTTVEGTATASTTITVTSTNTKYTCSETISWTASLPPPTATPGTYCGFTIQGPGICLDVAASGREVARVEVGVVVRCQPASEFELTLTFADAPIGGHLGFSKRSTSFEGLVAGSGSISGLIDPAGTSASGRVSLIQPSFDHEGTRYTCGVRVASWQAKRQT